MVRVCFSENCPRPHRVFGCVFNRDKAVYCDDCKDARPEIFHTCRLRREAPAIEETTHGLCPECAELLIAKIKQTPPRVIR